MRLLILFAAPQTGLDRFRPPPDSLAHYKARPGNIVGLSHVTIEAQACPGEH